MTNSFMTRKTNSFMTRKTCAILFCMLTVVVTSNVHTNHNTLKKLEPILAQYRISIAHLNMTAPRFVKLVDSIDDYTAKYLKRDLDVVRPYVEFFAKVWLPSEVNDTINRLDLFTNLSHEAKHIRTLVLSYINSMTAKMDLMTVIYKLDYYVRTRLPVQLQDYNTAFLQYYNTLASREFKTLYSDFIQYLNDHFNEEADSLEEYISYIKRHSSAA